MSTDQASYTSRNADKFVVRLPKGMRDQIAEVARRYHRSMNSEIVSRLETSLDGASLFQLEGSSPPPETEPAPIEANDLTTQEQSLLAVFRRLPPQKQAALVELLS